MRDESPRYESHEAGPCLTRRLGRPGGYLSRVLTVALLSFQLSTVSCAQQSSVKNLDVVATPSSCNVTAVGSLQDDLPYLFSVRCGPGVDSVNLRFSNRGATSTSISQPLIFTDPLDPSSLTDHVDVTRDDQHPEGTRSHFFSCSNVTTVVDQSSCVPFDIDSIFAGIYRPKVDNVCLIGGPQAIHGSPADVKAFEPIAVYRNVPQTVVIKSDYHKSLYVGHTALAAKNPSGYAGSSEIFEYRPRAPLGSSENLTVYSMAPDGRETQAYTFKLITKPSSDPRLASISTRPGRLEPEFKPSTYTYHVRVPPRSTKYSVTIEPLDIVDTGCQVTVGGHVTPVRGKTTVSVSIPPQGSGAPGSQIAKVHCVAAEKSYEVTYTMIFVRQSGGSTLLDDLQLLGGTLQQDFDPQNHGPYRANLHMTPSPSRGWCSFMVRPRNPKASVSIDGIALTSESSPWFHVVEGEQRRFQVAVRTPENPIEEVYFVDVDRRGTWFESAWFARKASRLLSALSLLSSATRPSSFLNNAHFMQFLGMSHRINALPESYDAFSGAFQPWNLDLGIHARPRDAFRDANTSIDGVIIRVPPEPYQYIETNTANKRIKALQDAKQTLANQLVRSLAGQFYVQKDSGWQSFPPLDAAATHDAIAKLTDSALRNLGDADTSGAAAKNAALVERDRRFEILSTVAAEFKKRESLGADMGTILVILIVLVILGIGYMGAVSYFVGKAIKNRNNSVRDMPRQLHPIRFWTFVADMVLAGMTLAVFGILSAPASMRRMEMSLWGMTITPGRMLWVAAFMIVLFPVAYLGAVAWVMMTLSKSAVFSRDIVKYHNKEIDVAKAQKRFLTWLPILSPLLTIEIRDVAPIVRATNEIVSLDERSRLRFAEDQRSGGPCNLNAPEFGRVHTQKIVMSHTRGGYSALESDPHHAMLGSEDRRIRYNCETDRLKVAIPPFRVSYYDDAENALVYDKYPDADFAVKPFRLRNPYGYEIDCHARVLLKHLSALWQMSEIPHHFHFWMPFERCQGADFDGWNVLLEKAQRTNFFYYLIDRVAFVAIIGVVCFIREIAGSWTMISLITLCAGLAAFYTLAAILHGTSQWYQCMEDDARRLEIDRKYAEDTHRVRNQWPFEDKHLRQTARDRERQREDMDRCGHGGWFARNPYFGWTTLAWWKFRSFFVARQWVCGAPGMEAAKASTLAFAALGSPSIGILSNSASFFFILIAVYLCAFFTNLESLKVLWQQLCVFGECVRLYADAFLIWCLEVASDTPHLTDRLMHWLKTTGKRLSGEVNASYDYPSASGDSVRDFDVDETLIVAEEVALHMRGELEPSNFTKAAAQDLGRRGQERYRLTKTLHKAGPLGIRRDGMMSVFPVRFPFRNLYLNKRESPSGVAATIHIVNHGFRSVLKDDKVKNVFTLDDDSYLTLYRDARYLPEWGQVRAQSGGHGYIVRYDGETHSLFIKGPALKEGLEYQINSELSRKAVREQEEDEGEYEDGGEVQQYESHYWAAARCVEDGTLAVPMARKYAPSEHEVVEVEASNGEKFPINPADVRIYYDTQTRELVLRHRLISTKGGGQYRISWASPAPPVPLNQRALCHEAGVLHVRLRERGVPDLDHIISLTDTNGVVIMIDPHDTNSHRTILPKELEARGVGLLLQRSAAKFKAFIRRIRGEDHPSDGVAEELIPCTIVQCVDPHVGRYRVEPDFREVMRNLRAQIHRLEAIKIRLEEDLSGLGRAWRVVMSSKDYCTFWTNRGLNIRPTAGIWLDPLNDIEEPLVREQKSTITKLTPELSRTVQRLLSQRLKALEAELHRMSLWARAYDDQGLYSAQLQKDAAEAEGYTMTTGLESYVKKLRSFKEQYTSQLHNFLYPFEVDEQCLARLPDVQSQLNLWERQLAVWLSAEEDMPREDLDESLHASAGRSASPALTSSRVRHGVALEKVVKDIMGSLRETVLKTENVGIGRKRSVLHYVADSLLIRGPYTNWRPDPIGGHLALVRTWHPKENGAPDFDREPVWNPCCLKLSGNAIKILLPGRDDVDYRFNTPYYWSHVLGHFIQLDCLEGLEISRQPSLPPGCAQNQMMRGMPGQLVCYLTSSLLHVGDRNIQLVESGAPAQGIYMKRAEDERLSYTARSSGGGTETFVISLGKRLPHHEGRNLPATEVRYVDRTAYAYPLTFRFGERFVPKWAAVIEAAQMDKPPLEIDPRFGVPEEIEEPAEQPPPPPPPPPPPMDMYPPPPSEESIEPLPVTYTGEWQNYRYHGKGRLVNEQGVEIYNGEWREGRRWGKGRCIFRDSGNTQWQLDGQFIDDDVTGRGHVSLVDEAELQRLRKSADPADNFRVVDFVGSFGGIARGTRRLQTTNAVGVNPHLPQYILKQLFDSDPSYSPQSVVIDVRRTLSALGGSGDSGASVADLVSHRPDRNSLEAVISEYLPHRSRWLSQVHPHAGWERLEDRFETGTVHFANGAVYQGMLKDGKPHGKGRYMSADESVRCEGHWRNGKPHGNCILSARADDGQEATFYGTFENGVRQGHGIQTARNNQIYIEGTWTGDQLVDSPEVLLHRQRSACSGEPHEIVRFTGSLVKGQPHGDCKVTWADGSFYRGQISEGKRHGQGVIRDRTGRILVSSTWHLDSPAGRVARLVQPDGKVYSGDFKEGMRQGMGELYHSEKGEPFYEGLWVNDLPEGRGTLYAPDGVYDGQFKHGMRHGKGTFEYSENPAPNGKSRLYEGDWRNDQPHGVGKYRNEMGVENTYKFHDGALDKASLAAYKRGACGPGCGKAPPMGVSPSVQRVGIKKQTQSHFGDDRAISGDVLKDSFALNAFGPSWLHLVEKRPMRFIDPAQAPPRALSPEGLPPPRPASEDYTAEGVPADFQTESPVRQRVLKMTVVRGVDIPRLERPFVRVLIGPEAKRTRVAERNEFNQDLNFPLRKEPNILVELWNRGEPSHEFVASGDLDLASFLSSNRRESGPINVALLKRNPRDGQNEPAGYITTALSIVERSGPVDDRSEDSLSNQGGYQYGVPDGAAAPSGVRPLRHPHSPIPKPFVFVRIIRGTDLPDMDLMKKMDPYVKVMVGKNTSVTRVQKRAGSNPTFNEEFFIPYHNETTLSLEVFDRDRLKADDFVGRAELPLPVTEFAGPLELYRADRKKGSVRAGLLEVIVDCEIDA